ncbi:MAG: HAMP domain-containing histidine kinase, partial [Clostridia bacterium]|nr:HAMP domain-containing histidine kinase [Clostridia bacterium]
WKNKWEELRERLPSSSMRTRLIAAFLLFALAAIGILWVLQTVLMDDLYEMVKYRELSVCADRLEKSLGTDTLEDTAFDLSQQYNLCLSVYQIRQGIGSEVTEQHSRMFCLLPMISTPNLLQVLYQKVSETEDGSYSEEISMDTLFQEAETPHDVREAETKPEPEDVDHTRSILHVRLYTIGGTRYMSLLTTEIQPLTSTVTTLQLQMVFLSVLLALLAVGLSVLLSARFARPLTRMSEEAVKLSMGNYNVNFDGGNCRETEQLSAALNRAAYELSRLDKMQKDLIANISHDLRTPLTMISGYSEVIRDLPGEATPENMQVIIDEVSRLTSLVNDMLEVSRYQSGSQILHTARFNFTECLRQTMARYAKLREREGYVIRLEAETDVWVEADETRILQVLYNLVGNAVNYTGEDKTVVVRQEIQENEVVLSVIDTGMGIPRDQLPLVWERYYKVHDFHKRANMGTGLGLSIVKNILVLHGARFGVQSIVGQGSQFWFALPLAPSEEDPVENRPEMNG